MSTLRNKLWIIMTACFMLLLILMVFSCRKKEDPPEPVVEEFHTTPYTIQVPSGFPTQLNIPADNPMTVEGIELGRNLFYDWRMGGRSDPDSGMSCSSCHLRSKAFELGEHPKGITGISTPHVMLPLFNVVWNPNGYFWNGYIYEQNPDPNFRRIEDVVRMGVYAPHEMNSDSNRSRNLIASIAGYKPLFKKAFGTEDVTFKRMSYAIAQFIRSIVSSDSKFDQYLRGAAQLTTSELSGYVLFMTEQGADCFHCHGSEGNPLFTNNLFFNNAKKLIPDVKDRSWVTHDPMDVGVYRAPTLRNIELTGPYMHDGRYETLEAVVNFYSDSLVWSPTVSPLMHKLSQGGALLTPPQKADLIAFLKTLTDWSLVNNPAYGPPASLPQ